MINDYNHEIYDPTLMDEEYSFKHQIHSYDKNDKGYTVWVKGEAESVNSKPRNIKINDIRVSMENGNFKRIRIDKSFEF